jgi:hypothetical protein
MPGFWKTENRCDMANINSTNRAHQASCDLSEGSRQSAIAAAVAAGGGSAAVAAAIKTAEIAYYRKIIQSCVANGLPYSNFSAGLFLNFGVTS